MTAGVALVGASVIAATPVAAPPPAIQTHAVQLSAAIDNPVEVFTPLFTGVGAVIENVVQGELQNPLPIINGLVGKLTADAQTLGTMANTLGESYSGLIAALPQALAAAGHKVAAGDFTGAVQAFLPIAFSPFLQTFFQYTNLEAFVEKQFDLAGQLTKEAMGAAWALGPGNLLGVYSVITAATGTVDAVIKAVPTGDPALVVNAIQHGVANVAVASLGLVNTVAGTFDAERWRIRDILNPPPPDPEELTAATPKVTTPSVRVAEAPAIEAPAPASTTETATDATAAVETRTDAATEPATPVARDTAVSTPNKTASTANKTATKRLSDVGERVSGSINKIGEGLKKAFAKPAKADKTTRADKSDAGAGSSGDAE
ncbi:hypothetical protein BST13_35655 [Mycobacterium aquaticum]|uniref:PE-PGRS family protein n=1 Tax=Mycobacterium aquaticum TaxID=1927124 RepID=A0A1W9ZZJ0_9MYCO|nr:hypothetical protein BST13_35655 [Mycobacterium aquaticum]